MNYNLLYQCVFCLAFFNFFIYWIDLFFFSSSYNKTHSLERKKELILILLPSNFKNFFFSQKPVSIEITKFIISLTLWCSLTLLIIFRYIQSNHFPLSNFYEALIFLTWSLVTLNFIILFEPFNSKIQNSSFSLNFSQISKNRIWSFFNVSYKNFLNFSRVLLFKPRSSHSINNLSLIPPAEKTGKNSVVKVKKKKFKTGIFFVQNSWIQFFKILPFQIKNNLAKKIFEEIFFILQENQKVIIRFSPRFSSLTALALQEKNTQSSNFPFNQSVNFKKKFFTNEPLQFKHIELQPVASLNIKECQSTSRNFFLLPDTLFRKGYTFDRFFPEHKTELKKQKEKQNGILKETKRDQFKNEQKKTEQEKKGQEKKIYGGILSPCILFILAFAQFNLSSEFTPLVPALKSNWLFMHVSIMICSYTTFLVGGLICLILLIVFSSSLITKKKEINGTLLRNEILNREKFFQKIKKQTLNNSFFIPFFYNAVAGLDKKISKGHGSYDQFSLPLRFQNFQTTLISQWINKKFFLKGSLNKLSYSTRDSLSISEALFVDYSDFSFRNEQSNPFQQFLQSLEFISPERKELSIGRELDRVEKRKTLSVPETLSIPEARSVPISLSVPKRDIGTYALSGTERDTGMKREIGEIGEIRKNLQRRVFKNKLPQIKQPMSLFANQKANNFNRTLDNLSYRMFGIGFPLFTLGLLSGAVWANSAWGSYWSWDIKEVGSFIHWLVLTFYFHCRYKNYIIFSHFVGFLSLIVLFFNFFGVSLGIYGSSLHAYS